MTPYEIALERIEECKKTQAKKLDLRGLGLTDLPLEVCELEWLEELDLSSLNYYFISKNFIHDLPVQLKLLRSLRSLNVSNCSLSNLQFLSKLPQLKSLNCSFNQLQSIEDIVHVPQLESLDCSRNQLKDLASLVHLPLLQSLDCSFNRRLNQLTSLAYVSQLKSLKCSGNHLENLSDLIHVPLLETLECSHNQLHNLADLIHISQLTSLECGGNKLENISDLRHVPQLKSLEFSYIELYDLNDLIHVPQLKSLKCNNNQLKNLTGLEYIPHLESLDCNYNQLQTLIDLAHVPLLESLECRYNQLKNLADLINVPRLHTLECSVNHLQNLADLKYVSRLKSLKCHSNQLKNLNGLEYVPKLKSLECSHNELHDLADLIHVPKLQSLKCNTNYLQNLTDLQHTSKLKFLECRNNKLQDLTDLIHVPQLQSLECDANNLKRLDGLKYIPELLSLVCSNNTLENLNELFHVPQLQALVCSSNKLKNLNDLVHTNKLKRLDCSNNQLLSLVSLSHTRLLESLQCASNNLKSITSLPLLSQLKLLNCGHNQLRDLNGLSNVPQLQSLNCDNNQLMSLIDLAQIGQLQSLDCNNNELKSLNDLAYVPLLESLSCNGNKLKKLTNLIHVPLLERLSCNSNELKDLTDLSYLPQLSMLDCGNNQITDITLLYDDILKNKYRYIDFFNNKIIGLPPVLFDTSFYESTSSAVKNYLKDLSQGEEKVRQIKLQIVGNGRVGKTTLAYVLEHKKAPPEAFKSTHGIVIKEIPQSVEGQNEPVTLQLWDFGGQEIYHAAHRLFLSNDCLYLMLWAEETEEHEDEIRHPVSYWLESLHDLGPDSPIILVKNQIDRSDKLPPRPEGLTHDLPGVSQIEADVKLSAMQYKGIPSLRGAIQSVLEKLAYRVCLNLPTSWLTVQDALKGMERQRTLPFAQFKQLCIKAGVSDPDWFVDYLHKSGLLFFKKGAFQDQIILDQNWVIEAVYTLFDPNKPFRASIESMLGRFSGLQAHMFWPELEQSEHEIYLSFMSNCSICYEPESHTNRNNETKPLDQRQFILPALLPQTSSSKIAWGDHQQDDWVLRVEYPFLHRSIIERLIIALGTRWTSDPWRHGIYCSSTPFGQVLLEAHYANKNESNRGHLSFSLRQHKRDDAVYELRELIQEISPHNRYLEYLQQGTEEEKQLPEFEKRDNRGTEFVAKAKLVNIFISYSHEDEKLYKNEIEKCLKGIKRRHPVEYWDDRQMFAGDLVDDTILERLETADIVLLLISRDFFASDYCFNKEMEAALKRYEAKKNVVIPIIIRETDDWHDFEIGKITALPTDGKPLGQWSDPDAFWADVQKGIRRQVEKLLGE